jgi:glycerol-3-phosphate dehydrogenase
VQTEVVIIGGGVTGTALLRDLALRGVDCVLVEMDDINAGASGRNHGLLHSGARYVSNDHEAAVECRVEGAILKRTAAWAVDDTGGYFVAVQGDDDRYIADFPSYCQAAGISVRPVDVAEARSREPALSEKTLAVYEVPDASIDPFRLSLECVAQARSLGARVVRHSRVVALEREGGRVTAVRLKSAANGIETRIEAAQVVNAAGAWAREVALLAGAPIDLLYSKGTLLVTHGRLSRRVINRLRPPSNADILVPGGTVSILGTTSTRIESLKDIRPTVAEADAIVDEASRMLPILESVRYVRAFSGVRPLAGAPAGGDGRTVSRGFVLLDHQNHGLTNFTTITGGKLSTCRLMAERTADLVCARLGNSQPCVTATQPIGPTSGICWTEPGLSPRTWMRKHGAHDPLICECEMVSGSVIDSIYRSLVDVGDRPTLTDIGLRSRLGKGACQGAFCVVRAVAYLCQHEAFQGRQGFDELVAFFAERWKGLSPVLWGEQMPQMEMMEALHCGLFGEELKP